MCQEKFRRVSFGTGPARADLTKAHLFLLTHRAGYGTITEYPRIQVSGNPRSSLCLPLRMQRLAPPRVSPPRVKIEGFFLNAGMMELVDMRDLGSRAFGVGVRVPMPAP